MNFPCTACGACCRHLPEASSLNTGNGVCRHLDPGTQRCAVYEQRPLICRIDDLYQERLASTLTPRKYYLLQAQACIALDQTNEAVPQAVARLLAEQNGGQCPDSLTADELAEGLHQVMAVATPLMAAT